MKSENDLFDAWRANPTPETEGQLVRALRRHATYISWRVLDELSEELLDDAVYRVLSVPEAFDSTKAKFSSWFHELTKNLAVSRWRSRQIVREREIPVSERDEPTADVLSQVDLWTDLGKILNPEELHIAVMLTEGAPMFEIAEDLGAWTNERQRVTPAFAKKVAGVKEKIKKYLES